MKKKGILAIGMLGVLVLLLIIRLLIPVKNQSVIVTRLKEQNVQGSTQNMLLAKSKLGIVWDCYKYDAIENVRWDVPLLGNTNIVKPYENIVRFKDGSYVLLKVKAEEMTPIVEANADIMMNKVANEKMKNELLSKVALYAGKGTPYTYYKLRVAAVFASGEAACTIECILCKEDTERMLKIYDESLQLPSGISYTYLKAEVSKPERSLLPDEKGAIADLSWNHGYYWGSRTQYMHMELKDNNLHVYFKY